MQCNPARNSEVPAANAALALTILIEMGSGGAAQRVSIRQSAHRTWKDHTGGLLRSEFATSCCKHGTRPTQCERDAQSDAGSYLGDCGRNGDDVDVGGGL